MDRQIKPLTLSKTLTSFTDQVQTTTKFQSAQANVPKGNLHCSKPTGRLLFEQTRIHHHTDERSAVVYPIRGDTASA